MIYAVNKVTKEHRVHPPGHPTNCDERFVEADAEGWIKWHQKGGCPVPRSSGVQIKTLDSIEGFTFARMIEHWYWSERGIHAIIAYRPILNQQEPTMTTTAHEWRGRQDGLPPVGTVCEFVNENGDHGVHTGAAVEVLCHYFPNPDFPKVAVAVFAANCIGGRRVDQAVKSCFRPIPTPRQRWVDEANNLWVIKDRFTPDFVEDVFGAIYDALKNGDLPMPEVE